MGSGPGQPLLEHALVFGCLAEALDTKLDLPLSQASVLFLYFIQKNVSGTRESPALKLIELIAKHLKLIVDTTNASGSRGVACDHVMKLRRRCRPGELGVDSS